jgi:hypothetical protein
VKEYGHDCSGPRRGPSDYYTSEYIKGTQPSGKKIFSKITFYSRSPLVSKLVIGLS